MKRYTVEFADSAEEDLFASYEWGCREWGEEAANRWARETRSKINTMLKTFPLGQSVAPESKNATVELRQMVVGRYRVIFTVKELEVRVFHITGSYVEDRPS